MGLCVQVAWQGSLIVLPPLEPIVLLALFLLCRVLQATTAQGDRPILNHAVPWLVGTVLQKQVQV